MKTTRLREVHSTKPHSSMTLSLSGRVILVRAKQPPNASSPKFVMLLCSPNTTLTRCSQLANVSLGMLSSLGQPERSTQRRNRQLQKGCWSPHPIAVRLRHLKESSMEPWERLSSTSLLCSTSNEADFQSQNRLPIFLLIEQLNRLSSSKKLWI